MLVQFEKPSQPIATYVQSNLNTSNRPMLLPDLSHITSISFLLATHFLLDLKIIPHFLLVQRYLYQIHRYQIQQCHHFVVCFESCNDVAFIVSKNCIIYYMISPSQQQSFEVIQLTSHQCVGIEI